jgi:hypothetical protein
VISAIACFGVVASITTMSARTRRMFLPHTLSPMIGMSCETQKPVEQRLAQGSHRIVCHIPADELARLTAASERTAP